MWVEPGGNKWYTRTYNGGVSVVYDVEDVPVLWWDAANITELNEQFYGAIIEYHSYCATSGTTIGRITIARDVNNQNVIHEETFSGNPPGSVFWNRSGDEMQLYYLPTGFPSSARIQFTSKVFCAHIPPVVTTDSINSLTYDPPYFMADVSGTTYGNINDIIARGFTWNLTGYPDITVDNFSMDKILSHSVVSGFSINDAAFVPSRTNYVRAFIITTEGTFYGNTISQFIGCLTSDTNITLFDGSKVMISEIEVGAQVLSINNTIETVIDKSEEHKSKVLNINGILKSTAEHIHYVRISTELEWKLMTTSQLSLGYMLQNMDGTEIEITSICPENEEQSVYSIKVSGSSLYYANEILTHNK